MINAVARQCRINVLAIDLDFFKSRIRADGQKLNFFRLSSLMERILIGPTPGKTPLIYNKKRKIDMKNLMQNYKTLSKKEKGATMVEYAIMVALIAIIAIAMIQGVGQNVNNTFNKVNSTLTSANG